MDKAKEKPKKYEERLMAVLAFDEADLEANEAGQISARQIIRLEGERRKAISAGVALSAFLTLVMAVWLGAALSAPAPQALDVLAPLLVYGLAIAATFFFFGKKARQLLTDMSEKSVQVSEGRVDLLLSNGQNNATYFLRVDNQRFQLKKNAFLAFKNGDPYRIYHTPRSKVILSAEWLRENDDNLRSDDDLRSDSLLPLDEEEQSGLSKND